MPKTENVVPEEVAPAAPIKPATKEPKEPKPDKVVDNKANAQKVKSKWDDLKKEDGKGRVHLPGTRKSVEMNHIEVVDNKVSVWTSTDKSGAPDFVIVNGPTEVLNEYGILVEDPLTAIAIAIDGVSE
jgi:hypothetical protein